MTPSDSEDVIERPVKVHSGRYFRSYSTFVVKFYWCFLLLGLVICIALGLSGVLLRDLPDFNDPTKGFVPRGKDTLTSRLFVLERVKNELDKQVAAAKVLDKKKASITTTTISSHKDEEEEDLDYEDILSESNLIEDLKNNPDACAFLSSNENKCLTNEKVYNLINNQSDLMKVPKTIEHQLNKPNEQMCTSIHLNRHYEVYFESSNKSSLNLLTIGNLLSLCKKQNKLIELFQLDSTCHYTLPQMISYFSNKSNCSELVENDITYFISRMQRCHQLYDTGLIRSAGLKRYRLKPIELFEYDSCFRYNFTFLTLEYLLDKTFLSTNQTRYTAMWFLKPKNPKKLINGSEIHTANSAYNLFLQHFYRNPKFDDGWTRILALNFLDIRISTAMKQIRADMFFVILAISLIVGVTIIYLRSIAVALMTNVCVVFSFACGYFTYKIALGIDLFPYINLMATFILIGISCDNVFVIFDAWYSEKLDIYNQARLHNQKVEFYGKLTRRQEQQYRRDCDYTISVKQKKMLLKIDNEEDNNQIEGKDDEEEEEEYFDRIKNPDLIRMMKVNDEQMIQMMGGLLRHAAASVFVTSFTTSAAFFTNMITRIAYVQLFGLFMGLCILFNFLMSITMIVSFVIVYEKVCEPLSARLGIFNHFPSLFDKILASLTRLSHAIFTVYIPRLIIKLRFILIIIFFIFGVIGLIIVFYHPKLSPPKTRRYQFFQLTHPFERFEYQMRDQFLSYINEDKDNVTNPLLIFIFGVEDNDLVHPFYPEDSKVNQNKQNIIYNKDIDFYDPNILRWFDTFLKDLNQSDLFINVQQTYSQWLTIGQLLRGFVTTNKETLLSANDKEFFVPRTRNQTVIAMNRLFNLFKGSNQFQSANDNSRGTENFRLGFLPDSKTKEIRAFLFTINMNVTFNSFTVQDDYYKKLQNYFETSLEQLRLSEGLNGHVYKQVKHGWFVSPQFLFYDLMREVIRGTYTSLIFSMLFALVVLLLTSGNVLITIYAMLTITFIIADTVAVFVLCGWELNILETIIIIMSVGLSVDFTVHYGVAYIKADWKKSEGQIKRPSNTLKLLDNNHKEKFQINGNMNNKQSIEKLHITNKKESFIQRMKKRHQQGNLQRYRRIKNSLVRVGSAVFVAGFTSFLAGVSMAPSKLTSFSQMGFFLMLIMFISWSFSTWFFLPLLSFIGPIDKFGDIPFGKLCRCRKKSPPSIVTDTVPINENEERNIKSKLNDEEAL